MALGVGFEPTTNRLHLSNCFQLGWTISSPRINGGEALPLNNRVLLLRIVSEPFLMITLRTWLLITMAFPIKDLGFQQFTSFFDSPYDEKLRYACVYLTMTVCAKQVAFIKLRLNTYP